MSSIARRWIAVGALLAAIAVALGAFGSHMLPDILARLGFTGDEAARRMSIFEKAVRYQMFHAIALMLTGLALQHRASGCLRFSAWAFLIGIVLFCGPLKVLTFADPSWNRLGAVAPFGGGFMIAGWIALAIGAVRAK